MNRIKISFFNKIIILMGIGIFFVLILCILYKNPFRIFIPEVKIRESKEISFYIERLKTEDMRGTTAYQIEKRIEEKNDLKKEEMKQLIRALTQSLNCEDNSENTKIVIIDSLGRISMSQPVEIKIATQTLLKVFDKNRASENKICEALIISLARISPENDKVKQILENAMKHKNKNISEAAQYAKSEIKAMKKLHHRSQK